MTKKIYFISDIHFGLEDETRENYKEEILVNFINKIEDASHFVILGDLFDYWFEYKKVIQKGYYRLFSALKELSKKGTKIIYIIGNHDFMHRDFFKKEFGAEMVDDFKEIIFFNSKFFLAHGDGLNPNDKGYLFLKKIFRNKIAQNLFSKLHPNFGVGLASKSSKKSRDYTSKIDFGENEQLLNFAKKKIDNGFDYVLLGHSHQKALEEYNNGFYINLGTWLKEANYGVFDGKNFKIVNLEVE